MELALFSVSYAGLWGQARLDLVEFIAKAAALGYRAVMLAGKRPHLSPLDMTDQRLAAVRDALEQHNVKCRAVAAYTDFSPPRAAEVPALEMQIGYVAELARFASALEAPIVRVFTAYVHSDTKPQPAWDTVVSSLRECADRAAAYGVTLAVQNHHDVAVQTDALLDLLAEIDRPNVKLAFDAWSPALRGEDLYQAARRAAPYTAITTNADYVRVPRYRYRSELVNYEPVEPVWVRAVPFGEGFVDYEAFFKGLSEGGFRGLASYEICSPIRGGGSIENLDRCAQTYLEWMRRELATR